MQYSFYILTVVVLYFESILGQSTPIPCTWTDSATGQTYDLSALSSASSDYKMNYDTTDAKKLVWINMCRPLVNTLCGTTVAGCQQWDPNNANGKATLGIASTLAFSYGTQSTGGSGLIAKFSGGTVVNNVPRNIEIDFTCSASAGIGTPTYVSETKTTLTYIFSWSTQYACAAGSTGGGGAGGLSGGSIFLIIFFVAIFVYFAAGVAYMKFKNHAEGTQMIPNHDFWFSLPGLVRDGGKFLIGKVRGNGGGAAYSQVK